MRYLLSPPVYSCDRRPSQQEVYPDASLSSSDSDDGDILETRVLEIPRRSANAPIAPNRVQLGSFLNQAETEIRSSNHATALIGLLELG
jgi:hypothetical protein